MFNSVLPRLLFFFFFVAIKCLLSLRALQLALLTLACWYQSNCWQAGYDMGRGVVDLFWTCLETCLELPKSRYLVSLHSDLMDQFEGSRRLDDHQWKQYYSTWKFMRDYIKITLGLYRSLWLETAAIQWRRPSVILRNYLAQRLECSPMARETWVQSQVESYQRL